MKDSILTGRVPWIHVGFALRPRRIASNGAVSARANLDPNQNDVFEEGDEPFQGVRFGRQRDDETSEGGVAFLTALSGSRPTNLAIVLSGRKDPVWIPIKDGAEVVPRPGRTVIIDFPVTATGEVNGTMFLRRGGAEREVCKMQLSAYRNAERRKSVGTSLGRRISACWPARGIRSRADLSPTRGAFSTVRAPPPWPAKLGPRLFARPQALQRRLFRRAA